MEREKKTSEITSIVVDGATFNHTDIKTPTFVNFFFGNNGTGKSTIASSIDSKAGLTFRSGKIDEDYEFLLYNEEFIAENMQSYENMPGVFSLSKEKKEVLQKIREEKLSLAEIEEEIGKKKSLESHYRQGIVARYTRLTDRCFNDTKELREKFDQAVTKKQKKALTEALMAITDPQPIADLGAYEKKYDAAYDDSAVPYSSVSKAPSINAECIPGYELLATPITSSSDTDFAKFMKALNATDWVRHGHSHYVPNAEGKCPFCQNKLPETFEDDIKACFDDDYQAAVGRLRAFREKYAQETTALKKAITYNPEYPFDADKQLHHNFVGLYSLISKTIELNLQKIADKITTPGTVAAIEDISPLITAINEVIDKINALIEEHNNVVNHQRTARKECSEEIMSHLAAMMKSAIDEYRKDKSDIEVEIKRTNTEINVLNQDLVDINKTIAYLNQQSANTEIAVNSINQILRDAGFTGFKLRKKEGVNDVYEVVRSNGKVAKRLSEGERNFIAFLYFYHKVKGIEDPAVGVRDKIVIIDDPVSSMDSSTLFIVSALVRELVEICRNNIDGENREVDGDYIKQIFILTHNAYFHREITYNQVKRYTYVNLYLIKKNDNVSTVTLCTKPDEDAPSRDVNFNPVKNSYAALWIEYNNLTTTIPLLNVIRQILEYYFLQLCGYEGKDLRDRLLKENRDKFVTINDDGTENVSDLNIVNSMLLYINSNSIGFNDGSHLIDDGTNAELCKDIFHKIFICMKQEQHYNMMIEVK